MENQEKYLSTGQLMDFLEISRSTGYRLMAKGMPNIMVGSVDSSRAGGLWNGWKARGNKLNDRATAMVEI
ncbi:MAG: hypothetical protein ABI923_12355 [bacterium]